MEPSGRVLLAVLCFSLAVCVLGRPQPSSPSAQNSTTVEALGNGSLQGSNRTLGFLHLGTLEVPWRRSLKGGRGGGGGGGRGARGVGGVGGVGGGGGGGGGGTSTTAIIIAVSCVTFVILLTAFLCWCSRKKRKNPNWRLRDCFKRNKLPREKLQTSVKSDVDPDAGGEHKVSIDVPRLDHTAKSRKQVSLSHDFKNSIK